MFKFDNFQKLKEAHEQYEQIVKKAYSLEVMLENNGYKNKKLLKQYEEAKNEWGYLKNPFTQK